MRPVSFLLLLPGLLAAALTPNAAAQGRLTTGGCPVRVSLRHNLSGGRMLRSSSEASPEHSVSVTVGSAGDMLAVKAADVTVHGLQMSNGFLPTYRGPREVKATFHLVRAENELGPLTAELKLPSSMASVGSATVEAITYQNGETWKAGESTCMAGIEATPVASLR